jgi:hypothetical protein
VDQTILPPDAEFNGYEDMVEKDVLFRSLILVLLLKT